MDSLTTDVNGQATGIPGLLIFEVTQVSDERGWFQEKFHREKLIAAGLPESFTIVQNSVAFNKKGATRGFHAEPWDKYISIVNGRAFAAYIDLRAGNSFGTVVSVELDPTRAVFVPAGVGNSYQCQTDLFYLYSVNQHWTPDAYERYGFVNLADPELDVAWPIPLNKALLSNKDRHHPLLREVSPMRF